MSKLINLSIILTLVVQNESAKILAVFPVPSVSHQVVFRPLTQELAKRGHEVVVITTDPIFEKGKSPENFTEIDVHDLSYDVWRKGVFSSAVTKGDKKDLQTQGAVVFSMLTEVFEMQLATPEVQNIIKDKSRKFDLIMVEAFPLVALGITHLFDAPVIQISSLGAMLYNVDTTGMPYHLFLHPLASAQRVYDLSNWEKLEELCNFYLIKWIFDDSEDRADKMLKRVIGPGVPSLRELRNKVDMLFLNVHPIWEMNRPSPPNVIYMGGLHQKPVKELPNDLKSYLDSSKNGVIYISFGTNVEPAMLPPNKISMLVNVFSRLPYDILWKWNKDELPGQTKNIKISKWLPQSDLLRHPKVKLFITQGGLQSTDEAITAGVPLIGIPLLGDQWYNVEQYAYHKIGLKLDMETITEEKIESAITTILKDERGYRQNVAKLRSVMKDQPQTPLDRAVWWTEYVIRHGGAKHLRSPAANMSWTQYYELELVSILLCAMLFGVFIVGYLFLMIYKLANKSRKVKKS